MVDTTEEKNGAHRGEGSDSSAVVRFQTSDVKKVSNALLEFGVWLEDYGDCKPYEAYKCQCCDGEGTAKKKDFKHDLDCPILIAQDLLTGI